LVALRTSEVSLNREPFRHAVVLSLLVATAPSCGHPPPDKTPENPPEEAVVATGDGDDAAGYFGPPGGELRLTAAGPIVFVPVDAKRVRGTALALKKDPGAAEAGAKALGAAFRLSATLEPPSNTFVDVWSVALPSLPAPCTTENLELAVLLDQQVGSSTALAWSYEKARWDGGHVKARLPTLAPQPLQFVCGRAAGGGQ
jgi:hypothetical protein